MIVFWSLVAIMLVAALAVIIQPLRGSRSSESVVTRLQQNISIARERLAELEGELQQGIIGQDSYEQSRAELEQALLQDVDDSRQNPDQDSAHNKTIAVNTLRGLLLIVPLFSIGLYVYLGKPGLLSAEQKPNANESAMPADHGHGAANGKLPSIEVMVDNLAKRLQREPDDAKGWFMLGRSYMALGQYTKAVTALEKTHKLMPGNPDVMLRYADALTMTQGGKIQGKPFELVQQALKIDPVNTTGLWLAGMGYEERGEHLAAISHWKRLLPLLQDDKSISEVKILISNARQKAGLGEDKTDEIIVAQKSHQPESNTAVSLNISVSLDAGLSDKVKNDDTVFIFARAVNGPPMPLAVVRKKVRDLPVKVELNDSMAMMPSMKLSAFKSVQVVARISKSGQPLSQPGDLSSKAKVISLPFKQTIPVVINTVTK